MSKLTDLVFEHSHAGMLIVDADFKIVDVNHAMLSMIGYLAEELIGESLLTIADPLSNPDLSAFMSRPAQDRINYDGEVWFASRHGKQFPSHVLMDPLKYNNQQISHFFLLSLNIAKQKQLESELRFHAQIDPLTSLGNRKLLFDKLDSALAAAKRFNYHVAVLFLDLDGFKRVNDSLGHGEGDKLLKEVARRLDLCVRQLDTVARLGGDEFVVILNGTDTQTINTTAQRILEALTIHIPSEPVDLHISASIGIAIYPDNGHKTMSLLKCADEAMYQAKSQGKRQFCWYPETQPSS